MGLIYKIACEKTSKCYIGQTIDKLKRRIQNHLSDSKRGSNCLIHKAIRKYGWKHFKVEVLEDNIPLENLNKRELYYTEKYNALAPNGYVLIAGGEPRIVSEETRRKQSNAKLKNHNALTKNVLCYDLNDNFIKEYNCGRDAERELKLYRGSVSSVCTGYRKKTKNYKFKYKNNE